MSYVMRYVGVRKINAIKSIRAITGNGLKISLAAIRNPNGFIVTRLDCDAIIKDYVATGWGDIITRLNAWEVRPYLAVLPYDLRPVPVLSVTRQEDV